MIRNFDELEMGNTPYAVGRAIYKGLECGPWTVFVLRSGRKVYYADQEASGRDLVGEIVGIEVGSIVEGSDAEVGPFRLMFPFTEEDLDELLDYVNIEACCLWDEANGEEDES